MNDFFNSLKQVKEQESAQAFVEAFCAEVYDENQSLRKDFITSLFTQMYNNFENQKVASISKFYHLYIIHLLSNKDKLTSKIFGTFSNSPLYKYLEDIAYNIDPKKSITEKGKTLFPDDRQTGNRFMRLLLESFMSWGKRFPNNSKKEPTKFKKTLMKLQQLKVTLPNTKQKSQKQPQRTDTRQSEKRKPENFQTPTGQPKGQDSTQKFSKQMKYLYDQMQIYFENIESAQSIEELSVEVQNSHAKFEKNLKRLNESPQTVQKLDEAHLSLYCSLNEIYNQQSQIYKKHILTNGDYQNYVTDFMMHFEKIFAVSTKRNQKKSMRDSKPKNYSDQKEAEEPKFVPAKENVTPKAKQIEKQEKSQRVSNIRQNPRMKEEVSNKRGYNAIQTFFSRLQSVDKSPIIFSSIAKSIDKQKKTAVSVGKKRNLHTSTFNKSSKFAASTVKKSKFKGIFAHPPNNSVVDKSYNGDLVLQNAALERQFKHVQKQQGHRRFSMSNFRNKYILFESQVMQIGIKTEQIFEKIQSFNYLISCQMFFGNKTNQRIENLELFFQGDKDSLLYTSPERIEKHIQPQSQIRFELINIPKSMPFGFINMDLAFEHRNSFHNPKILIPNSVIKLCNFFKVEKNEIQNYWGNCVKYLKSQTFKLAHYYPPDQFKKLINLLNENIPFDVFATEGNQYDYELYCEAILEESYQGILKIIVRPNLSAIIQVGLYDSDENSFQKFKFLVQSLQVLLKEIDF